MNSLFRVRWLLVCMLGIVAWHSVARGDDAIPALSFNGSNARVTIPHSAHLSALPAITAEIWFKTATAKNQMPLSMFNNANREWFIQLRDNGTTVRVGIQTTKDFTLPARYDDDQWHHLAMTYNGSQIEVFFNGESLGTQAHTDPILPPQQHGRVQLDPVRIGSGTADWFAGQLAEARIWNYARCGLKIRADMHRRLPGDLPGLLGYWRLDEGDGATVADETPYGIDGTIANATWTTADLDLTGFVVADRRVNGIYYTGSNEVNLVRLPVPDGYTHFQITEDDDPGALGPWSPTSAIPITVVGFSTPSVNTNVMLYGWFTNTSETVELKQSVSRIVYTDATPTALAHDVLRPYRRLTPGGAVTVTGEDIDNGSSGGEQDGLTLAIAAWTAVCDSTPDCDTSSATPGVTLDQTGAYSLRLIVVNEAGNAAQAALATAVNVVQSDVLYVAAGGDHGAGTSWATALTNVQWDAGLAGVQSVFDFVHDDNTIYLSGGTYKVGPRLQWSQSNLLVRGGYEGVGAPGVFDPAHWPTTLTRDTVIATGIAGQRLGGLAIEGAVGGRLESVTIRDAYNYNAGAWLNGSYNAAASYFEPGANLLIRNSSSLTVANAEFSDGFISANYAPCHGAGVAVVDSENILLEHCRILRNSARANRAYSSYAGGIQGIGLFSASSSLTITNSLVGESFMTSVEDGWDTRGAGIYIGGGELRLLESRVAGNTALGRGHSARMNRGGGIAIEGGTHRIWNSLIVLNTIYSTRDHYDSYGDGLYVTDATLSVENSTLAQNIGQGLYSRNSTLAITNSIVWGNHKDMDVAGGEDLFSHSNFGDETYAGENGCISVDTRFERGFRLAPDSECIDAGGLTVAQAGLTGYTTRADGTPDTGNVDLGYHWRAGLDPAVADLYVSAAGGDDNNAGTPAAPLKTITEALDRADHGTRVHIEAGTYSRTSNDESFPLAIEHKFGIELLGTNAAVTIIDQERPGASNVNQWRVLTIQNTGGGTRIEGLTLTRGWSRHLQYYGTPGAGIGAWYSVFTVNSSILTENYCAWAAGSAGGLYVDNSMVLVTDTLVVNNSNDSDWESYGAGIHVVGDSDLRVLNSRIANNQNHSRHGSRGIHLHGAGVCISHVGQRWSGNTTFINSEIVDNYFSGKGDQFGAGLASMGGNLLLRNCLISGNIGNQDPAKTLITGGVYIRGGTARIENCTITDNEAEGLGLFAANNPDIEIVNTIVWGHSDDIGNLPESMFSHSCASNLTTGVQGNLNDNPLFVDADEGDYRLMRDVDEISPCINQGQNQSWMIGSVDLDGNRRILEGRVDMGAYESIPPRGTLIMIR